MNEELILKIQNFCVSSNISGQNLDIIKDFSFELKKGEIAGLFSPTGSGKTTLLNAIAGILNPKLIKNGTIELAENTVVSYAFQDFRLLERLSVLDNLLVILDGNIKKEKAPVQNDEVLQMLDAMGLLEKKAVKAGLLSGGEKQRLSLARALLFPADLVLLDEPFNALSPKVRKSVIDFTKDYLCKRNRSALIVSHNLEELEFLCSKITGLEKES